MSVLIKGMEMPTRCADCLLEYDSILCRATGNSFIYRSEAEGGYVDFYDTRMPDCPLVHVPPHGRLIDADELKEAFCCNCFCDDNPMECNEPCMDMKILLDAPTVIPADKDGET